MLMKMTQKKRQKKRGGGVQKRQGARRSEVKSQGEACSWIAAGILLVHPRKGSLQLTVKQGLGCDCFYLFSD